MPWLSLLSGAFKLVNGLVGYINKKQLMDAGEARAMNRALTKMMKNVDKANAARRAVKHDPDSLRDDPDRRD